MKAWQKLLESNDAAEWLVALAVFTAVLVAVPIVRYVTARLFRSVSRRAGVAWGDALADTLQTTSITLFVPLALYVAQLSLAVPARVEKVVALVAIAALLLQIALWGNRAIGFWIRRKIDIARGTDPDGATALSLIGFGARALLWIFVLLLALDQLGFDITALLAGLGVGGIAVALATQNILGDLFASLSIVLDKPFVVGDFIVIDNLRGTVERVGIKTTRIRSLDGELLVFANADLLKSRIQNYQRMVERRVLFSVGVTYQTPNEKVERITQWLREAIEAQSGTRFDRAHFKEYGDSALVYEIVYYVLTRASTARISRITATRRSISRSSITCSIGTTTRSWTCSRRSILPFLRVLSARVWTLRTRRARCISQRARCRRRRAEERRPACPSSANA